MSERFRPSPSLGKDLLRIFPAARISQSSADRLVYSRDMWPKPLLSVRDNKPSVNPPDYVVWPESTEEICELVRLARAQRVPLVPWGGGSGVCGGAVAVQGGIIVDMKRMNAVVDVSAVDYLATFQTGIVGQTLEDQLNLRGLTLGHFPASIYCSTLGGWLAARSAGQLSSRYGKIEDMVQGLEVVLGDGRVLRCEPGQEPDLAQILVGSEGTLGFITEATLRVKPLPEHRVFRAYEFPRVTAGCDGMRQVMQLGLRPAVLRLYDEADSLLARSSGQGKSKGGLVENLSHQLSERRQGLLLDAQLALTHAALSKAGFLGRMVESVLPKISRGCMCIVGFEGEPALVEAEVELCHAEFLRAGARDLGEGPGLAWYRKRYAVSYKQSPIYTGGGFADTMEVATTWGKLLPLYHAVRAALSPLVLVLAHFSHAYPEGCSIYFTFAAAADGRAKSDNLYEEVWRRGLTAVVRAGGTISHHHGVGLSKASFMAEEHGPALAVYRQLKSVMDPAGILNPGKMGL